MLLNISGLYYSIYLINRRNKLDQPQSLNQKEGENKKWQAKRLAILIYRFENHFLF